MTHENETPSAAHQSPGVRDLPLSNPLGFPLFNSPLDTFQNLPGVSVAGDGTNTGLIGDQHWSGFTTDNTMSLGSFGQGASLAGMINEGDTTGAGTGGSTEVDALLSLSRPAA